MFYSQFLSSPAASSLSHTYSKSQLNEKLRRLRKKFRSLSLHLDHGLLEVSMLQSHDRDLFDLSRCLWSPQLASSCPFFKYSTSTATSEVCLDDDDNYNYNVSDDYGNKGNSGLEKSDDDCVSKYDNEEDGYVDGSNDFDLKEVSVGYDSSSSDSSNHNNNSDTVV